MKTYRIVRFFSDDTPKEAVMRGLTLKEAQEYCSDPMTHGTLPSGVMWFDGYEEESRPRLYAVQ
jgi:hypothetical protein